MSEKVRSWKWDHEEGNHGHVCGKFHLCGRCCQTCVGGFEADFDHLGQQLGGLVGHRIREDRGQTGAPHFSDSNIQKNIQHLFSILWVLTQWSHWYEHFFLDLLNSLIFYLFTKCNAIFSLTFLNARLSIFPLPLFLKFNSAFLDSALWTFLDSCLFLKFSHYFLSNKSLPDL